MGAGAKKPIKLQRFVKRRRPFDQKTSNKKHCRIHGEHSAQRCWWSLRSRLTRSWKRLFARDFGGSRERHCHVAFPNTKPSHDEC